MNELTTMTNDELDMQLALLDERERMFESEGGKKTVIGEMEKLLTMLEKCGCKLKGASKDALTKIWAGKLKDQIIRIGFTGVQEAAVRWVQDDEDEYNTFPKAAWIYDKCNEIKGDPRVEKSIREQKRREALIEEEHRVEMEKWKKEHPAEWTEVERRADELVSRMESIGASREDQA